MAAEKKKKTAVKKQSSSDMPPLPPCDRCRTNKHVVLVGPDVLGSDFHCSKCRSSWMQTW